MKRSLLAGIATLLLASEAFTADKAAWKKRTVYQLLTDRYAKGDGSKPNCNLSKYCGGNFDGI